MIIEVDAQSVLDAEQAAEFRRAMTHLLRQAREHAAAERKARKDLKAAKKALSKAQRAEDRYYEGEGRQASDLDWARRSKELAEIVGQAELEAIEARARRREEAANRDRCQRERGNLARRWFTPCPLLDRDAIEQKIEQKPVEPAGCCHVCGCTASDCRRCVERTGHPCSWMDMAETLCSACAPLLEIDLFLADVPVSIAKRKALEQSGITTVGDALEMDTGSPPRGLSADDVTGLVRSLRQWLQEQLKLDEEGNPLMMDECPPEESLSHPLDKVEEPTPIEEKPKRTRKRKEPS